MRADLLITVALVGGMGLPAVGAQPDRCGAAELQVFVGELVSELADIELQEPSRMIGPNTATTRDYRVERLNIHFDEGFVITRIDCG